MKKQSFFSRWMKNNYVLFAVSLLISLVIWGYMTFTSSSTDTTFTVNDVPIQIELSEDARALGLQVFTTDTPKASVTVSGNRTVLGMVSASDFNVTAAASSINASGNYTLPVSVNKRSTMGNFQIDNSSPATISVTVDYFKETEFQLQDGIIFYVEDGYYGTASLPYNTISISGPQTEMLKIKKVVAKATISGTLKESQDVDAQIVLLDENDNEISQKLLKLSYDTVKATITVLPEKNVSVKPAFTNKPEGLEITDSMITVTPSTLLLAGPEKTLNTINSVNLEPIDFSKLTNQKVDFDELAIEFPENCKSIGNYNSAKVTLDLSGLTTKTITVDKFTVEGLSKDYSSTVTSSSVSVVVVGAKADIDKLTASNITAVIDTSSLSGKTGSVEMPVTFRFNGVTTCWAYGTYQANVTITKK